MFRFPLTALSSFLWPPKLKVSTFTIVKRPTKQKPHSNRQLNGTVKKHAISLCCLLSQLKLGEMARIDSTPFLVQFSIFWANSAVFMMTKVQKHSWSFLQALLSKCNTIHWLCSLEMGNTDYPRNYAGRNTASVTALVMCYKLEAF